MSAEALRETFAAYVRAESVSTRAFIGYKFGEVREAEVHRLQDLARKAADAHEAAISEIGGQS